MPFRPFAWVRCVCECELCESILFEIMICFFLVYFFFRGDENLHNLCDLKKFDQLSTGLRADWHVCPHIHVCTRTHTRSHAPVYDYHTHLNKTDNILCLFNANCFFSIEFSQPNYDLQPKNAYKPK